ncbi:hypothetical protein NB063_10585 [Rhodopirellula sp. ICT_H3.1]|uniref:Uncharacterized protein n=1 Tax=Aporhodopirellula aestuarii TaxID=2950107 RepID=A0ABT0U2G8_9BACT|nr:hypothetical protein [Aporhodopirellula aestuarii]MCM2371055.1 hypothetical protein [Aporhodopirellula aestuarii]
MEQKIVKKLESEIEEAIAEVIMKMGLKRLPFLPSQQTMHLMSKAAVIDPVTERFKALAKLIVPLARAMNRWQANDCPSSSMNSLSVLSARSMKRLSSVMPAPYITHE